MPTDPARMLPTDLVPHRPPILMVDRLDAYHGDHGQSTCVIHPDNPLLDSTGTLHPLAAVEIMAQGVAASNGYEVRTGMHQNTNGMIVAIKSLEVLSEIRAGDTVEAYFQLEQRFQDFQVVKAQLKRNEKTVATARIQFWTGPDFPAQRQSP